MPSRRAVLKSAALAAAAQGWALRRATAGERVAFALAGLLLVFPSLLEPLAAAAVRISGSGAQREIVQDTLLVALMRSGQAEKALALLDSRLHRRPSPRDAAWHAGLGT